MEFELGDNVLCTVERIEGTTVFVTIDGGKEGSIIVSEIAPGRIRNLRDYVVPKKKIVCKILRISDRGNIELSLRRVSQKERKDVLDKYNQERAYVSILKKVLGEKTESIIEKIKSDESLADFFAEAKTNPKKLEKLVGKDAEKILEILNVQKTKKAVAKKEIVLKSESPEGIEVVKKVLGLDLNAEIKYLAAGRYSVQVVSDDIKKASTILREVVEKLEKKARENKAEFSIKEK